MYFQLYLLLYIGVAKAKLTSKIINATDIGLATLEQNKDEINILKDNPILHIHNSQENDKIKRNLDKFTMKRRKTNFAIPRVEVLDKTDIEDSIIQKREIFRQPNQIEDTNDSFLYNDPKLFLIMRKQTVLMTKLLELLDEEKQSERNGKKNDFEELLNDIEMKHEIGSHEETIGIIPDNRITETTTKKALVTVMTMIDETEVREALKNDPLVKRILKLNGKKRKNYFKRIKKASNKPQMDLTR